MVVLECRVPQVTWVPHSFAYFANEWALRTAPIMNCG